MASIGQSMDTKFGALEVSVAGVKTAMSTLATKADVAGTKASIDATKVSIDALTTQLGLVNTNIATIMATLGMPGAAAAAAEQARANARRTNAVTSDAPLIIVARADGRAPVSWPAGLTLAALWALPGADADALLLEYALGGVGGSVDARRVRLARYIGAIA